MPAARRIVIDLDETLASFVDRRVAAGPHDDAASVVLSIIGDRALDEASSVLIPPNGQELETILRTAISDYLASSEEGREIDEFFDELEAELAAKHNA